MPEQEEVRESVEGDGEENDWIAVSRVLEEGQADGEDPEPFSLLSSSGLLNLSEKIPLEESPNLLLMREMAALIRRDQVSHEEYLENVQQVAEVANNGIKLFSNDAVKAEVAKLPPEHAELVFEFERQVYVLKEGTDLMASYVESGNIEDLERGLELVESSMLVVDRIQDTALDYQAAEKAAKEEEEGG